MKQVADNTDRGISVCISVHVVVCTCWRFYHLPANWAEPLMKVFVLWVWRTSTQRETDSEI